MPLRTILAGLDGSSYSEAAADLAVRWAQKFDARLAALGVVDKPTIRTPQSEPVGGARLDEQLESKHVKRAHQEVEEYLSDFADDCLEAQLEFELIENVGKPFEQILSEAVRYDVVVLGKETHFHFEKPRNPGKTLNKVLRSSPRPVVAVPENNHNDGGVLVAYDGSISSARALQLLVGNSLHQLGEIHVLSVDGENDQTAASHANRACDFLRYHDVNCHKLPVVSEDNVGRIILDEAVRVGAGLIVMGAFGRTALAEMILGSVTEYVILNSPTPVFLAN